MGTCSILKRVSIVLKNAYYLYVRPSACLSRAATGRIYIRLNIRGLLHVWISVNKLQIWLKSRGKKNMRHFKWRPEEVCIVAGDILSPSRHYCATLNVFILPIAPRNSVTHTARDVAFQPQIYEIYLPTAIGLTPHIHTQTIHRTTQITREQHK